MERLLLFVVERRRYRCGGQGQKEIGQEGVAGQDRSVQISTDDPTARAPSVPEPAPLPTPAMTRPRADTEGPRVVTPAWFSNPLSRSRRTPQRRTTPLSSTSAESGMGSETSSPTQRRPVPLTVSTSRRPTPAQRRPSGPGKDRPHDLVTGAHGQNGGPGRHRRGQRPVGQTLGRLDLRPVLAAADAVEIGPPGQRPVRRGQHQFHGQTAPGGTTGQDPAIATVAVGTEEIGVDHHHPQGRRARALRAPATTRRRVGNGTGWGCDRSDVGPGTGAPERFPSVGDAVGEVAVPERSAADKQPAQILKGGVVPDVLDTGPPPTRRGRRADRPPSCGPRRRSADGRPDRDDAPRWPPPTGPPVSRSPRPTTTTGRGRRRCGR